MLRLDPLPRLGELLLALHVRLSRRLVRIRCVERRLLLLLLEGRRRRVLLQLTLLLRELLLEQARGRHGRVG